MISLKKISKWFQKNIDSGARQAKGKGLLITNVLLIALQVIYIKLRYSYINPTIPFWYTQSWGDAMLADKLYIYLLPTVALFILVLALAFEFFLRSFFVRSLKDVLMTFVTLSNVMITLSLLRIIFSASVPFPPLVPPLVLSLSAPFVIGFAAAYILLPYFINFAVDRDIVTDPRLHQHPGMVLNDVSARGGGFFYMLIFVVLGILFVGIPHNLIGFYIAVVMMGVLGFVDDYQNTHPKTAFRSLENPLLRLILVISAVSVLVLSGMIITSVGNPLGGIVDLTNFKIVLAGRELGFVAGIVTVLWITWVINLLSWSNGIDGQYTGIIGLSSLFICILALRFVPISEEFMQVAILAALSSGIAFGFTKYTWFPSKMMWGFGAMSAGAVIASLAIIINTKILVSILILLIPFLDAIVTFVRRILQGRSPLKGDRGHLHHLLLDMGWSVKKIALFYWFTTIIFGLIGVFASERYLLQTVLIVGGVAAFIIVLVNVKSLKKPLT